MSLSTCIHCGGHIPLGPDATNCCVDCGKFVFSSPVPSESDLPYEAARRIQLLEDKLRAAEERLGEALSLLILKDSMLDGRDRHALKRDNEISELQCRAEAAEAEVARLNKAFHEANVEAPRVGLERSARIAALEAGLDYCIKQIPEFATVPGIAALLDGRGE